MEDYIEIEAQPVKRKFLTQKLWDYKNRIEGKIWQLVTFYILFWTVFIWLAIVIDFTVVSVKILFFLFKKVLELLWTLSLQILSRIFLPVLRNTIFVAILIMLLIIVFYRFSFIRDHILEIFDKTVKP